MTIQKTEDYELETGLDDFGVTDAVIPRVTIVHDDGTFKDNLSGQEYEELEVIFLGLIKQRVLWHPVPAEEGSDNPMCKSQDFHFGFPNVDDNPQEKLFPWSESGYDEEDFAGEEQIKIACDNCLLKDWGSHPDGKKPYCSEQWTMPMLYNSTPDLEEPTWTPAIITFQKTSLKPLKTYLTSFARSKQPVFTKIARIGLDARKRGKTIYQIANFKAVGNTEQENWIEYGEGYREFREFLTADPEVRSDEEEVEEQPAPAPPKETKRPPIKRGGTNTVKPPVKKKPEPEPEPVVDAEVVADSNYDDDDEPPF